MYYVCIENNEVCGVLSYQPNVPATVSVHTISNDEYRRLNDGRHRFNIDNLQVESLPTEILDQMDHHVATANFREFLNSTDWKVLRHIRQKALGIPTSLTEQEYMALEQQRQEAADKI